MLWLKDGKLILKDCPRCPCCACTTRADSQSVDDTGQPDLTITASNFSCNMGGGPIGMVHPFTSIATIGGVKTWVWDFTTAFPPPAYCQNYGNIAPRWQISRPDGCKWTIKLLWYLGATPADGGSNDVCLEVSGGKFTGSYSVKTGTGVDVGPGVPPNFNGTVTITFA